jgi:hypothetical protein
MGIGTWNLLSVREWLPTLRTDIPGIFATPMGLTAKDTRISLNPLAEAKEFPPSFALPPK